MKKISFLILFLSLSFFSVYAQSQQAKAEDLVKKYLESKSKNKSNYQNLRFSKLAILRSSYEDTQTYKMLLYKVDSLKTEGKKIDAKIAKMKTAAELNKAKKDSYQLSHEMIIASNKLIDFMTEYKGSPKGWYISPIRNQKSNYSISKKVFYLNQQLSKIDSVG